jgi:PPP family 3-phenylpropionic acid transporter
MDGLYFAWQRHRGARHLDTPPYHRIRVLGTLGFILPSGVLFALVRPEGGLAVILPVAAIFAVFALVNAFTLQDLPSATEAGAPVARLPTLDAARALFSRPVLPFCAATALLQISHAGFYAFYPIHLVQNLGIESRWLGAISTVGVAVEAALMPLFGWLMARFGVRRLLVFGAVVTGLRLAVLAVAPGATPAILVNMLHGFVILGTLVAPVVFVNRMAGDAFRHSMQGVYTVALVGPARIGASLLCGWVSAIDIRITFTIGAISAAVAALLMLGLPKPGHAADNEAADT